LRAEPAVLAPLLAAVLACSDSEPVELACAETTCSSVVMWSRTACCSRSRRPTASRSEVRACLGDQCATARPTDLNSSVRLIIDAHFETRQQASLTVSRTDQEGATVLLDARTENPVGELVYAKGENCPPQPCLIADLALDGTVLAPV
jgi:dihydropteroate synthase